MEIVKLGDICNINIGTTPSTGNNKFWDGTVSFYDGSLTSKRYITKLAVNQLKLKLTKENSFVMSIFGNYSPILIPPGSYYNQQIALITSKNELIVSHKYIYYWIKKNQVYIKSNSIGTVANHINKNILTNLNFSHPSFIQQQTIIDIIEPKEELFLKFKNLVRIDNIENCKNDIKDLIDIIEPFELKKTNLIDMKLRIKDFIKNHYDYNSSENYVFFDDYCNFISNKYIDQKKYIDTSMVKELEILEPEKIMIKKSRANLSLSINSIIFSKMNGENKVYPIYNDSLLKNVYSTGFYNVSSDNNFHLLGFMLSKSFLEQKSNASVGTLMAGLNSNSFKKIYFKKPKDSKTSFNFLLEYINLIDLKIKKTNEIISNIIELYTK